MKVGAEEDIYIAKALNIPFSMNSLDALNNVPTLPDTFKAERQLPTESNLALWNAAQAGDLEGLKVAIGQGGNPDFLKGNEDGKPSSLHAAANIAGVSCTKELIQSGADVNVTLISNFNTPLHEAASNGALQICKILIGAGATINSGSRNAFGNTPLHAATRVGSADCVNLLIKEGADLNAVNNRGSTALHFCSFLSDPKFDSEDGNDNNGISTDKFIVVAALLILGGIDVNDNDENGYTALHVASQRGVMDMVRLLVDSGAALTGKTKVDWKGRGGRTPAEMAGFGDQKKALTFLKEKEKQTEEGVSVASGQIAKSIVATL